MKYELWANFKDDEEYDIYGDQASKIIAIEIDNLSEDEIEDKIREIYHEWMEGQMDDIETGGWIKIKEERNV